jgi:hypothetical protein
MNGRITSFGLTETSFGPAETSFGPAETSCGPAETSFGPADKVPDSDSGSALCHSEPAKNPESVSSQGVFSNAFSPCTGPD